MEEDATEKARRERRRALIVPREHGAWGLLLVPMITGAGIAFRESATVFPFVLLLTAAVALFWLRTPLESYLGTSALRAQTAEERRDVLFAVAYLGAVASLAVAMLLKSGSYPLLWYVGIVAGVAFVAQALLKETGKRISRQAAPTSHEGERPRGRRAAGSLRMFSEMVGTIGLTSSAPAAYYVMTGRFGVTAWMLWLCNLLFAGNQVHYVQMRIHTARVARSREKLATGWTFAAGQLVMAAFLGLMCSQGWMPWIAMFAFLPALVRGFAYFFQKPRPLLVRRLGWNELAQAVAFCVLFIGTVAFR